MANLLSAGDIGRLPPVSPAESDSIAFFDNSTKGIGRTTLALLQGTPYTVTTGTSSGTGGTSTVTLNGLRGRITTAALTTAAAASHVITMTNSSVAVGDTVRAQVRYGTATTGEVVVYSTLAPAANTATIAIKNFAAAAAVNGTLVVDFWVEKNS